MATAERRVDGADPDACLRHVAGQARGFWARGERWVVHGGELLRLETGGGSGRFAEIRDRAAALLCEHTAGDRVRFYGGFSFRADHTPEEHWEAYPPALFLLPRLEIVGEGEERCTLRLRAALDEGADADATVRRLADELEVVARELVRPPAPLAAAPRVPAADERYETDRAAWERAVEETLGAIRGGQIRKAVLARTLDVLVAGAVDPAAVALALWRQNRRAGRRDGRDSHAFLFEPRVGQPLVGAAPETVTQLRKGIFRATAVAGSVRSGSSQAERARRAQDLLASRKDREEQRVVVEDMKARLTPIAEDIRVQEEPHVLTLARIQHLESEIRARLSEERHVLDVLAILHPTPAVCGVPRDAALEVLRREEPFDRGWYAGPVGWFDDLGDGMFVPALRSAVLRRGRWRLFAGAGIMAGSEPAAEWDETAIKFEPVLRALEEAARERKLEGGR